MAVTFEDQETVVRNLEERKREKEKSRHFKNSRYKRNLFMMKKILWRVG